MLSGQTPTLEASRIICSLIHLNPDLVDEDDHNSFIGIESEIDDLSLGPVRKEWHPDFLPEKENEITRCEALWHEKVVAACERIVWRNQKIN